MSMSAFLKTRALSISDNIIAAILFLGGAIVAGWLTDYLSQRYGLTPQIALVLSWSVGLLVFVALSLLLRPKKSQEAPVSPAQQLNQSGIVNAPHNEFNPTVVVQVPVSHPQTQPQRQERDIAKPNIVVKRVRISKGEENDTFADATDVKAKALVEFKNDADVPFPVSRTTVRASVHFNEIEGEDMRDVSDGHWLGESGGSVTFRPGDVKALLIAALTSDGAKTLTVSERARPLFSLYERMGIDLPAGAYNVEVQLFTVTTNAFLGKHQFRLITRPELYIQEIRKLTRFEKLRALAKFRAEGKKILEECADVRHVPLEAEAGEWRCRVIEFLTEHLDETHLITFNDPVEIVRWPKPSYGNIHDFLSKLYTELLILDQFIKQIGTD